VHTRKIKKRLSNEFVNELTKISAGYLSPEQFDRLVNLIENECSKRIFDRGAESNFLRILQSRFDKIAFLNDCIKYPHFIEILISISVNSKYLSDILVRDPEFFYWISNPSNLNEKLDHENFSKSLNDLSSSFKSHKAKTNALRGIKRKELLRIGTKDILGISDIEETVLQLSILAKEITAHLFSLCYKEILRKYELEGLNRSYCILGLGKLGGHELNYSSDIDLIIFYDNDSPLDHKKEYYEILTETIYLFIESATSITSSGFIYRVDFRLRPEGRTSPLCRSLSNYLNYYETRGEDWERQMLIKADYIGGDKELFFRFINYLQPFIYPSSFLISPVDQIKKLKDNIERGLKSEENIKLQSGGIRDIEFSVQALQLLNGGKNKSLRTSNTLDAIEVLRKNNLLDPEEAENLRSSYIFYRRIEHYLQLMNDSQTHIIPSKGEILEKLSSYLNFDSPAKFKSEVEKRRKMVREIYNSIMGIKLNLKKKSTDFSSINFENYKNARADLQYLREGKGLLGNREFDQKSIDAFTKIEPAFLGYLKNSLKPDNVIKNFVRIIRNVNFPSIWYNEFLDKKFFRFFLSLCEYSQKSIDLFAEDKDLHEFFITRKIFLKLSGEDIKEFSVKKLIFLLSVQFSESLISYPEVSRILHEFFKDRIKTNSKHLIEKELPSSEYFIAAMGSFGAGEMTFSSDIDLIFVVSDINAVPEIEKRFQTFLNELKKDLKPFDVDCRLRPEGKSSWLTWELSSYENYILNRARIWELQSFCKLNFICGNKKLFNSFTAAAVKRIKDEDKNDIKNEMKNMRRKLYPSDLSSVTKIFNIKKSPGGILDIDFIVQYFMLSDTSLFKLCMGKGTIRNLKKILEIKNERALLSLKHNFLFLKKLELCSQVMLNNTTSSLSVNKDISNVFTRRLDFKNPEDFQNRLNQVKKENFSLFEKYLS
jgi:glutamate-ammonia-ligase adenylyltransferase